MMIDTLARPLVSAEVPRLHSTPVTQRYWPRLAFVGILSCAAYAFVIADVIGNAISGSRAVVLLVLPILTAVIATGYRQAPRGVNDAESDWIVAAVVGLLGFTGIHLVQQRMPTLSGLWQLDLLGVVLWIACLLAIMFGIRHVVRMWRLWLFVTCCISPLPFLMTVAAFGGSDTAVTLLTSGIGALAVFLAGRVAPPRQRLLATVVCLASATAVALVVGDHLGLAVTVMLVAGIVPAVVTVVMLLRGDPATTSAWTDLPHRSRVSLMILVLIAAVLLALNPPHTSDHHASRAAVDWIERAGLGAPEVFPFITRFLGPDATLVRYPVPAEAGMPPAAVDVITTGQPAALDDFADATWYPTSRPVEYRPATGDSMPAGARIIHTNADAATDGAVVDWYAVTWVWQSGTASQRVTVIVNQTAGSDQPPPAPAPLSLLDTSIKPALWIARQQPDDGGQVDELVAQRAATVINLLVDSPGTERAAAVHD